jgi:hypothetical protein
MKFAKKLTIIAVLITVIMTGSVFAGTDIRLGPLSFYSGIGDWHYLTEQRVVFISPLKKSDDYILVDYSKGIKSIRLLKIKSFYFYGSYWLEVPDSCVVSEDNIALNELPKFIKLKMKLSKFNSLMSSLKKHFKDNSPNSAKE